MKNKIKRIINLIILIAIALIMLIGIKSIPSFLTKTSTIEKIIDAEVLAKGPGAAFEIGTDATLSHQGDYWRVIVPGIKQIYCAKKGGSLNARGYTYDQVLAYVQSMNGKVFKHECGASSLNTDMISKLNYFISSTRKANDAEAFILTWPINGDWNEWDGIKQEAVWDVPTLSNNVKPPKECINGLIADNIRVYAEGYATFINQIRANGGKIIKGDLTNKDNVKVCATQSKNEYTVGPFKIDYVPGMYGLTFGGIKNMYIIGESGQIAIKSFVIDGKEVTPKYFEPLDAHLVAVGEQGYPMPGQEFYVKFVSSTEQQVNKIHIDFEWMEAEANLTFYKAKKFQPQLVAHPHDIHCCKTHYFWNVLTGTMEQQSCDGCCFDCTLQVKVKEISGDGAQDLLSSEGRRWLHQESMEINIPNPDEPKPTPTPTPGPTPTPTPTPIPTPTPTPKNLQIKLAGYVWEDEDNNKESLPNGKKDSNEDWKRGVEVILHYEDGSEVARTVTDNNGYYEFSGLNAQKKYYVEFVYDGQIYQATQYFNDISEDERLQHNSGLKDIYSCATEKANERVKYNNNFAEVSSAPESYKVRRKLYKNVGETNTAYIVSKPSTETPYGIKEIYEDVINEATRYKNYSKAYEVVLNKYSSVKDIKNKLQFIEDCRISSYTGLDESRMVYPIWNNFIEASEDRVVAGVKYHALYPKHLNIDFGLNKRETFDFALRKDVQKAAVEINGKVHTYTYDTRETNDSTWDISVRLSDRYYNTGYSREVFGSDYQYKATNYGANYADYGKSKDDELNVYVTYRISIRNQSQSILGEVTEIVDYFDEDYEYVDDRSYVQFSKSDNEKHEAKASTESKYGTKNQTTISGYNAIYVRGLEGVKLASGQTAYVFLTFRIKKDIKADGENWIRLDEVVESAEAIGVGKENIAEINGFKTYYRKDTEIPNVGKTPEGKVAGLFDYDAVPGNLNPSDVPKDGDIKFENFEDDTDKAPNIRLILYRENGKLVVRKIDGIVWEDERTEKVGKATIGNGKVDGKENGINGVTVQLVELMDNGTQFVWKTFSSGQGEFTPIINVSNLIPTDKDETQGKYIFKSFMTGNFVVRFIYGDTVKTVLPNTSTEVTNAFGTQGLNAKSYNGQDYKSTTYQTGIDQNMSYNRNPDVWEGSTYLWREDSKYEHGNEILGAIKTKVQTFKSDASNNETANAMVSESEQKGYIYDITASQGKNASDAKDIESRRNQVIDYSDEKITNYIAEVLASHEKLPLKTSELRTKLEELMTKTKMTAETGMMVIEVEYNRKAIDTKLGDEAKIQGDYEITDVNLGLVERPKAQLAINKEVTNVKLTLADGSTLFDTNQKVQNVMWVKHPGYISVQDKYFNSKNMFTQNPMDAIRTKNGSSNDLIFGLIQLSMDEELMHGATIKVSYKVTVTNIGEVDYKENSFYYTGKVANEANIVKTRVDQIIDYVPNNMQFYKDDNKSWNVIDRDALLNGLVNDKLAETDNDKIAKYNTIVTAKHDEWLTPKVYNETNSSVSDDLVLTQLITPENEEDDLTYRNIVEIVMTSNTVGRRMAYSIVGNQDPTKEPAEIDSDRAQIVKILPPYGENRTIPYIIGTSIIILCTMLAVGIFFIVKKTSKK